MSTTSAIGPFTRISYFGRGAFTELFLDITKFKMRRAKEINRQRYWNERWDTIKEGVAKGFARGEWVIAIRYDVPTDLHHVDNHTTLFSLAPGCTTPVLLACDDHRVMLNDYWSGEAKLVRETDMKALQLFPTLV